MTEDLQLNVDALEKERDFYFGKLREIELLCQEREDDDMQDNEPLSTLVNTIKEIMYATDDAELSTDHDTDFTFSTQISPR